jgi:methanogenic corrinoid protein MtbC1
MKEEIMSQSHLQDELSRYVADLDEKAALTVVQQRMKAEYDPFRIIESCKQGVHEVGIRYEEGRYFIAGLIMAGLILRTVIEHVQPALENQTRRPQKGSIVVGTVAGDIHDIGKELGKVLLSCEGFQVIDLGVDVPAQKFVESIRDHVPRIVVLSCLLTTAFDNMKHTVNAIQEQGLRSGLSIMIAGSMVNEDVCHYVEADYWTNDAINGVQWCKRIVEKPSVLPARNG